jgi:hypothetical protein
MPFYSSVRGLYGATGKLSPDTRIGYTEARPASSATAIKSANPSAPDGVYWISAAWTGNVATQVYCDLTTDGGGWMLYSCKVSHTFATYSGVLDSNRFTSINSDTRGYIPTSSYTDALWRFADKVGKPYMTKWTKANGSGAQASLFSSFLSNPVSNGFNNGAVSAGFRTTSNGSTFSPVSLSAGLYFFDTQGVSEEHGAGGDKVIDLWGSGPDSNNNYYFTDNSAGNGQKCVAGYCYYTEPVLYMWR